MALHLPIPSGFSPVPPVPIHRGCIGGTEPIYRGSVRRNSFRSPVGAVFNPGLDLSDRTGADAIGTGGTGFDKFRYIGMLVS